MIEICNCQKIILTIILSVIATQVYADCRDSSVKRQFDKMNGYPDGRKGYVVDHICPLVVGGIDSPINMQYQTKKEAKAKDKWEATWIGKKILCNAKNSTPTRQVFNCK